MRLQQQDLLSYCNVLNRETNGKYSIIAEKSEYWYWKLYIQNNETKEKEGLATYWLNLREAHEYLRAFYEGIRFQKSILNSN